MRFVLMSVLLSLSVGCVSSGTHDALLKKHAVEVARGKGLEAALAEEIGKVAAITRDKQALELRLQELTVEKANLLKDQSQLTSSIEDMQSALRELETRRRAAEARVAEFKSLLDRFKPLMDAGRLRVKMVAGRMVVELATDVLFDSGKAKLSEDGAKAVQEVAGLLVTIPERDFQVEGHTDNVPISSSRFPSNWVLASARALTVVETMIEAGMPPNRLSGASYGEHRPVGDNETDEGKARNRRIEIVVVPDLSSLPGFEELKKMGNQGQM